MSDQSGFDYDFFFPEFRTGMDLSTYTGSGSSGFNYGNYELGESDLAQPVPTMSHCHTQIVEG